MTPGRIDTVTDVLINLHDAVGQFGPGLVAAGAAWGVWGMLRRRNARRARLRALAAYRRQITRERQQMGHLRDAIEGAPLIPTQPGQDDDLLTACWDAWKADQPRKEQP